MRQLLKSLLLFSVLIAPFSLMIAPLHAQYGDGQKATMFDIGYYWKPGKDSNGYPRKQCFNVGNNERTDYWRCIEAEKMVRKGYKSGD
jgi:hypothetical protein